MISAYKNCLRIPELKKRLLFTFGIIALCRLASMIPCPGVNPAGLKAVFSANKGEGIHHIAFNVDKVAESLTEVEEKGVRLIDKAPRKGAENLMIGFLHPKSTCSVLTELCQQPE